jgi:threonine dehydrogenase-like Zn-dependent dehydrogenase
MPLVCPWRQDTADRDVTTRLKFSQPERIPTAGLALAMESIRPRGTLVLKSTVANTHTLSLAPLVINEITVVGSRCGRFPPALQALAHGHVTVTPLIDRIYPLAEGLQALAHAARPGTRKIVLRMF